MSPWRDTARPLVAAALAATAGKPEREVRKALIEAYPFGPRQYHPYKIWLDEIRVQRGLKKRRTPKQRAAVEPPPEQESLFGEVPR